MKQESHQHPGKHMSSSQHQANPASNHTIQPKPVFFRFLYKCFKYGTVLTVIVFILLSGISILGDTSIEVEDNRRIFDVYKNNQDFTGHVDRIKTLFDKQSSKFVSNKAVNLYLKDRAHDESQTDKQTINFDDLSQFSEFLISQRYKGENVLYLPLSLSQQKGGHIVAESDSQKLLDLLRKNVQKILLKYKISEPESVKELKWNRVKKLFENGKVNELIQLVKDNLIDSVWQWVKNSPSVIVLTVENEQMSGKNKKLLNRWVKQNSDDSEIIILSRYPINTIYDVKEDHFKQLQIKVSINSIQQNEFCQFFQQTFNLKQVNCQSIKTKFNTLSQLKSFIESHQQNKLTSSLLQSTKQSTQLLDQVCTNGHVKHYFYQNQQNINKVLTKSKKGKKSRLDRELQALLVKWSHLKKSMGLNRLKDIFLTLTSYQYEGEKMSLRDMNELGLVYDFDVNELRWRNEEEKLEYEIRSGRLCKDGRRVQVENSEQVRKSLQQEQKQEQVRQQQEVYQQEQQEQGHQEVRQQEYEQNFIDRNKEEQEHVEDEQTIVEEGENEEVQEEEEVVADEQIEGGEEQQQQQDQVEQQGQAEQEQGNQGEQTVQYQQQQQQQENGEQIKEQVQQQQKIEDQQQVVVGQRVEPQSKEVEQQQTEEQQQQGQNSQQQGEEEEQQQQVQILAVEVIQESNNNEVQQTNTESVSINEEPQQPIVDQHQQKQ